MATILVVDDEPMMLTVLGSLLQLQGYEVLSASDGEQAIGLVGSRPTDLVTLDIMMPRMDGWAVLDAIRADPATEALPVIVITALPEPLDLSMATAVDADWVMTKPFEPDDLFDVIRRLLGGRAEGTG